jgi:hypothetical protein
MSILSKNIEIEMDLPLNADDIEKKLAELGIIPLRYAIVNIDGYKITINVAYESL